MRGEYMETVKMEENCPQVDIKNNWKYVQDAPSSTIWRKANNCLRYVTVVEKRLLEAVKSHSPTFEEIESLISQ